MFSHVCKIYTSIITYLSRSECEKVGFHGLAFAAMLAPTMSKA